MIDTVLYDFGNVLVQWDPREALRESLSETEMDQFFAEADFGSYNLARDAGRTVAEEAKIVAVEHPEHASTFARYIENFERSLIGPIEGSEALVAELDATGVQLYGLTNWSAELYWAAEPAAPAIGYMRDVVVSGRERLAKPDPAIFELTRDRFSLNPSTTVFIDDSRANVDAAASLGFQAVHFTTTPALRHALRDLGMDVGAAN